MVSGRVLAYSHIHAFAVHLSRHFLEGYVEINYGKNTYVLEKGDSIYYDSIVKHHVHGYNGQKARILAVVYTPI